MTAKEYLNRVLVESQRLEGATRSLAQAKKKFDTSIKSRFRNAVEDGPGECVEQISYERARRRHDCQKEIVDSMQMQIDRLASYMPIPRWEEELRLRFGDGWSVERIARELGLCKRTVYRDLAKAIILIDEKGLLNAIEEY